MSAGTEVSEAKLFARINAADLLQTVLEKSAHDVPVDSMAVYSYFHDVDEVVLLASLPHQPSDSVRDAVATFCKEGASTDTLSAGAIPDSGFAAARLFLFKLEDEPIGVLVLLSRSHHIKEKDLARLHYSFTLLENLLQNDRRAQSEAISRTIQAIARQVGEGVTPQDLVNLVAEHVLDDQIRFCALLLFGPRREDRPNGPFAYLEMQGAWSNRFGSGVGVGMHLYLDQYTEMLQEIEERKIWHIPDIRAVETRFDSLARGFIRSANIRSVVMIALESFGRQLGVMVIGTEPNREFDQRDFRSYRAISEFLALRAMAHLLKQEQDFVQRGRSALLDAVHDGVLMILPSAGSTTGDSSKTSVLTVNNAFSALFGISQMRAQGLSLPQLLTKMQLPEDVRQTLRHHWLATSLRDPDVQRGDFTMIHPDGFHTLIGWYSAPVHQANRVMGRIYIFHDVTDDRTAVSLRATFVSRMSHELRTPLTSIKGFSQYILEELTSSLTPAVRDYVEIIKDNAQLLNSLFSDIIEITRADVGDLKLNTSPTRMLDLVEHVVGPFEAQCTAENKSIQHHFETDLPIVQIDAGRISRVLAQLVKNALQHSPAEALVLITAQLITASGQLPFGAPPDVILPGVLVTVEDQGDGIAAEDTELIFQPFYRTREARAARLEGSGLGLALARSMMTLHRGKIWAEARRRGRKGARVFFILPVSAD